MHPGSPLVGHAKTGSLEATPTTPSAKANASGPLRRLEHGPLDAVVPSLMSHFQKLMRSPLQASPLTWKAESLAPTEKRELPPKISWKTTAMFVRNQLRAPGKAERLNQGHHHRRQGRREVLIENKECGEPIAIKATIPKTSTIGAIST